MDNWSSTYKSTNKFILRSCFFLSKQTFYKSPELYFSHIARPNEVIASCSSLDLVQHSRRIMLSGDDSHTLIECIWNRGWLEFRGSCVLLIFGEVRIKNSRHFIHIRLNANFPTLLENPWNCSKNFQMSLHLHNRATNINYHSKAEMMVAIGHYFESSEARSENPFVCDTTHYEWD